MTIKQMLVGSLIGAAALGTMLHRLLKQHESQNVKQQAKQSSPLVPDAQRKRNGDMRLSLGKVFE